MQGQSNAQRAELLGGGDKDIDWAGRLHGRGDLISPRMSEKPFQVERTVDVGKPQGDSAGANPASATSHVTLMPSLHPGRMRDKP